MSTAALRKESAFKVLVTFESREDGGLRAYCEDVPGFVLSNPDCDVVLTGVEPTLETILTSMFGSPVRVSCLRELHEIWDGLKESGVISDQAKREYVGIPAQV